MQELLQELIVINREMLSELRLIRQALGAAPGGERSAPPRYEAALAEPAPSQEEPTFDIQEAPRTPPPRFTPQDLEDIHGSLLKGLKQRNKEKSDAFDQFQKRHKDW
ncbi:hypothetical protein [Fundidesulfovibrio soli]|uniref:hypothetical protein n=1 Tax=Fundidesulfovibrio soli TaxID=2922716 RepID=UPI001FAE7E1F|nr:hypothetical protein [Fundidesulfovibrio soli]